MKEIRAELENVYKLFEKMKQDRNLLLIEKQTINSFEGENFLAEDLKNSLESFIDVKNQRTVITNELIRKLIVDESTLSTSTIEGEIVDEDAYFQAEADLNSLDKDIRKKYSSILSLKDILSSYIFPNKIDSDEIKKIHRKVFNDKKFNPGYFKASNNFVAISENEKLMYVSASDVDVELNSLWKFINDTETDSNPIIKSTLIHMYLALIHPFKDGNGRVIRLLFNKYLTKMLGFDVYLDKYILENIDLYKENLNNFRSDNIHEVNSFAYFVCSLLGSYQNDHRKTLNELTKKFLSIKDKVDSIKDLKATMVEPLSGFIAKNKYFTIKTLEHDLNTTRVTATKYVDLLLKAKLVESKDGSRGRIYLSLV